MSRAFVRGLGLVLLAVLLVALGAWWASTVGGGAAVDGEIRTMLVLPFSDMSPSGEYAYYGDGLAEEITTTLARVEGLAVTPRTTAFALRERPLEEVASAAAVDAVLRELGAVAEDELHHADPLLHVGRVDRQVAHAVLLEHELHHAVDAHHALPLDRCAHAVVDNELAVGP